MVSGKDVRGHTQEGWTGAAGARTHTHRAWGCWFAREHLVPSLIHRSTSSLQHDFPHEGTHSQGAHRRRRGQTPAWCQTKPASQAGYFSMALGTRNTAGSGGRDMLDAGFPICPRSMGPTSNSQPHYHPSPLPLATGLVTVSHADWLASPI